MVWYFEAKYYQNRVKREREAIMDDSASGTAAKMVKNISDATADVRETANDVVRHAVGKIESIRETVAGTIEETSAALQSGGKQISQIADAAAEKINESASYVRETDLRVIAKNAKNFVKRHPVASIVIGAVAGFVLAWSFRSDD
jgi:ElaB/YqjD/DUF883 family membrane-anchored ribosome-binding protein